MRGKKIPEHFPSSEALEIGALDSIRELKVIQRKAEVERSRAGGDAAGVRGVPWRKSAA
jgi:hypothetical protein